MSKVVKLTIKVNTADDAQLKALSNLLNVIGNDAALETSDKAKDAEVIEPIVLDTKKVAAPKTVKKEVAKAEEKLEEVEQEEVAETEQEETSDYTTDEVRAEVTKKAINNRDEIKKKLTALGANNVTSLDESKYGELMDYLATLK